MPRLKNEDFKQILGLENKPRELKKLREFIEERLAERREAGDTSHLKGARKWFEEDLFPALKTRFPKIFTRPISQSSEHSRAVRAIASQHNYKLKLDEAKGAKATQMGRRSRVSSLDMESSKKKRQKGERRLRGRPRKVQKDPVLESDRLHSPTDQSGFEFKYISEIYKDQDEHGEEEDDEEEDEHDEDRDEHDKDTEEESSQAEAQPPTKEMNPFVNHRTESVVSHDTYPALTVMAPTLQPNHDLDCVIETYRVRRTRGGVTQRTRISKVVLFDILHDERGDGLLAKYVSFEKWQESVARDLDVELEELSKTCALYILMKDGAWDLVRWNSPSNFRATIRCCFPRDCDKPIEIEIRDAEQKRYW